MATKQEWREYFELVNSRKPTLEEFQAAIKAGEIDTAQAPQMPPQAVKKAVAPQGLPPKKTGKKTGIIAGTVVAALALGTGVYANRLTVIKTFESPKQAFGTDLMALSTDKSFNAAKVQLSLDNFQMSEGDANASRDDELNDLNKTYTGFSMGMTAEEDKANQTMALACSGKIAGQNYALGAVLGRDGMYINNSDIKNTLSNLQPGSIRDESAFDLGYYVENARRYSDCFSNNYLLVDAKTIDEGLPYGQKWEDEWAKIFNQSTSQQNTPNTFMPNIKVAYDGTPDADFSKKGATTVMTLKGGDLETFLENSAPTDGIYTRTQVEQAFDAIKNSMNMDDTLTVTINSATHDVKFRFDGNLSSKADTHETQGSLALQVSMDMALSKSTKTITEPGSQDVETLRQWIYKGDDVD